MTYRISPCACTGGVPHRTLVLPDGTPIHVFDDVLITGRCSDAAVGRVERMAGVVATISPATPGDPEDIDAVKVWPADGRGGGKLWFPVAGLEAVELVERDDWYPSPFSDALAALAELAALPDDQTPEADAIRDRLEGLWGKLTEGERAAWDRENERLAAAENA